METTEQLELKEIAQMMSALIIQQWGANPQRPAFWIRLSEKLSDGVKGKKITPRNAADIKDQVIALYKPSIYEAKKASTWTMRI